jgi:hypothetical protein
MVRTIGWGVLALSVVASMPIAAGAQAPGKSVDACTVLSADEIKMALGRNDLGAAKASRASGGSSDCRFPAAGLGDVRVILGPTTKADFDLKPEIYSEEHRKFEKTAGLGDGAYYFEDTVEMRVGSTLLSLFVNRTPRTESPTTVKTALINLAKRAAERLRAAS